MSSVTKKENVDIIISGGTVITMQGVSENGDGKKEEVIEGGAVAISDDSIAFVGTEVDVKSMYDAKTTIDAKGCVVMPGLINGHTHAAMSLFRGIADDLPLETWLNDFIFPAEGQNLDEDFVYWGTKLAIAEMLLGGITTFCDMYLFEDSVAKATSEMKMRGVLGEVLYDFTSPNYGEIAQGFEYTENFIKKWKNDPLITPSVQPHALDTCSPELLTRAGEISKTHDVLCIVHVAESRANVAQVKERYNQTPFQYLDALGILNENFVADHAVWVTDEELDIIADRKVKVITNPESNMKLASGWAPIHKYLKKGVVVGLGTDGCASNNDLNIFGEMDTLAKLHKIYDEDPTHMDAHTAVELATIGGAKALGLSETNGTLEVGKRADIIIVDFNKPHLTPIYNPFSHLVYAAMASDVRDVIVNGEILVKDGGLTQADTAEIMAKANELSERVKLSIKKL